MGRRYTSGKHAIADCDRCGFQYKLKELKSLYVRTTDTHIKVCKNCWEPDHPQNMQGMYPVDDPQAVRDPRPDTNDYTFVYWKLKRIDDAGNGVNTQEIPFRFYPCLVAGLAYYLSLKIPGAADRMQMLKQEYEEQWMLASTEDREKADLRLAPRYQHI